MDFRTTRRQRPMPRRPHGHTIDGKTGKQVRTTPGNSPLLHQGAHPDASEIKPSQVPVVASQEPRHKVPSPKGEAKANKDLLETDSKVCDHCRLRQHHHLGPLWIMRQRWPPIPIQSLLQDPGTAALTQQQQTENREIARLLREAYPDAQTRPAEATAAIERAEQGIKKNVTKSLHSATKALDRAQKLLAETSDARRVHRNSWLAHLTESIKTWETQLETYRKHGAALQEMALKARADIAAARADIQRLSSQESDGQAALAAVPAPLAEEGHQEDVVDSEEEKLRLQLQSILQTCAGSIGVTATSPADVQTIISDEEREERGTNKRPRSVEPGAPQPGQAAK